MILRQKWILSDLYYVSATWPDTLFMHLISENSSAGFPITTTEHIELLRRTELQSALGLSCFYSCIPPCISLRAHQCCPWSCGCCPHSHCLCFSPLEGQSSWESVPYLGPCTTTVFVNKLLGRKQDNGHTDLVM